MKTFKGSLFLGLVLGAVATLLGSSIFRGYSADAQGGGGAATKNGDINGDGTINISDAIELLNYLFLGTGEISPLECDPPVTGGSRFRLVTDVRCNQDIITGTLEVCGESIADTTDAFGTYIPSSCASHEPGAACAVRFVANTACGTIEFCGDVDLQDDHVYDFVFYFDNALGAPGVGWFDTAMTAGAVDCPTFPTPATPFTGFLGACGVGAGGSVGDWTANAWGR